MQRRRLIRSVATVGAVAIAGCLSQSDPTPRDSPIDTGAHQAYRAEATELAYVTLGLEGCHPSISGIEVHPVATTDGDVAHPSIEAGLITDFEDRSTTAITIAQCTPTSSSHDPYLETPDAFITETHLSFAYIVAVKASAAAEVSIDFVGSLDGDRAYLEVSTTPGDTEILTLARIGSPSPPSHLLIGIGDDTSPDGRDVYELVG